MLKGAPPPHGRRGTTRRGGRGWGGGSRPPGRRRRAGRSGRGSSRPPGSPGTVTPQRALRVVGGCVDPEGDDQGVAASGTRPTRPARQTPVSHSASPVSGGSGTLRVAPSRTHPRLRGMTDDVREPPEGRVDVHRPVEHVVARVEDRRRPVAVVRVDVDDADAGEPGVPQRPPPPPPRCSGSRSRRTRPASRGAPVAGRARRPAAPRPRRGRRPLRRSRRRHEPPPTCPARRASSCRNRTVPRRRARPRPGAPGGRPSSPASGRGSAPRGPVRPATRTDRRPTGRPPCAGTPASSAECTRPQRLVADPDGASTKRRPEGNASPGSRPLGEAVSVPTVCTPTHTSPRGSCSRVSGDHSTGTSY